MRYVLITFVWLAHGLATDNTWIDAAFSVVGWLSSLSIVKGWYQYDQKAQGDILEEAADLATEIEDLSAEIENMEQENTLLRGKLAKYERSHFDKLLEKSHRKNP